MEIIKKYWQEVEQITRDLEPNKKFSTPDLIEHLMRYLPEGSKGVTKTQINYLRIQGILRPLGQDEGKERTNWRYATEDVRRVLLVEFLKIRDALSIQESKGWIRSFEETQTSEILTIQQQNYIDIQTSTSSIPPTAVSSAYSLLRNRVLGILIRVLGFEVENKVPAECLIALHPLTDDTTAPLLYHSSWDEGHERLESGKWFLAVSDTYSKLYIYSDMNQLRERRKEVVQRLSAHDAIWLYLQLEATNQQCYEVIIAFPAEYKSSLLDTIAKGERNVQLEKFLGISTLLYSAFINQPQIKGGTPLSAMVEIIATASDIWDYCAILVPDDDDVKTRELRIQEYSSGFPIEIKEEQVAIGDFLTGWSFKYNQSIVVDPAIDNDPRLAFFEEEKPKAAIAIPTTASGQHVTGVIYVARNKEIAGDRNVFSKELLACLDIFGYICGDMITRDKIEIETVYSASHLSIGQQALPFQDLRSLIEKAVDEGLHNIDPVKEAQSWIYFLTLNIQATAQDKITQWLCQQGVEITRGFLTNHIDTNHSDDEQSFPAPSISLPLGYYMRSHDKYVFAILRSVDLPEEEYKRRITKLEDKINQLSIENLKPRFYPSAITFRYEVLNKLYKEKGMSSLVDDLTGRLDERLRAGLSLKRGHQHLYTAQIDQAVTDFEDALRNAPNSWYALKHLAEARMLQGSEKSIRQAVENCQKAIALNPDYASAHCVLADCFVLQKEFAQAVVHYEKALDLDRTRVSFLTRYGIALASMTSNQYKDALTHLQAEGPQLFHIREYRADPYAEAINRFEQARDLSLERGDGMENEEQEIFAKYYYYKGFAHLQAQMLDEAIEDLGMGRKRSPNNLYLLQSYTFAVNLQQKEKRGI